MPEEDNAGNMADATLTQHVCLVDRILDKRVDSETAQTEYLISWQGFDPQGNEFEDTWEPESNVLGEELVEEFERSLARQRSFQQKRPLEAPDCGSKDQSRHDPPSPRHYHSSRPDTQNMDHPHPSHHYPASFYPPPGFYRPLSPTIHSTFGVYRPIHGRPTGRTSLKRKPSHDNQKTNKENLVNQPVNEILDIPKRHKDVNGSSRIKIMSLALDTEKNYFKALIEKSKLIKDEVRSDLIQFLGNPKQPGLSEASPLLKSETWLMELNDKSDHSLCIAMDIPNGVVKAIFVPRLLDQRKAPDNGVVITDRSIVLAVMAGEKNSGLYPTAITTCEEEASEGPALKSPRSSEFQELPQKSGKAVVSSESNSNQQSVLSRNVEDHHLHLYNALDSDISPLGDQVSWRDRYELVKDAYNSLQRDISKLKDLVSRGEVQIYDSNALYQKSLKASIMYSKRLEARMEWERTKWQQYAELRGTMEKRRSSTLSSGNDNDSPIVDMPMESEVNIIQEIHQLLTHAKEEQEILKEKNDLLCQERQTLSVECKRIQESYNEAAGRLQELEAKHTITTDELKRRTANVETLRVTMEQKREQTQATIEQLQSKIGELMSSPIQQESSMSSKSQSSKPFIDPASFQSSDKSMTIDAQSYKVIVDDPNAEESAIVIPPLLNPDAPLPLSTTSTTTNADYPSFINMLTNSMGPQ